MSSGHSLWDQLTRVVILLLLMAALLAAVVWTLPLMRQNEQMRKEVFRLDGKIQEETDQQKRTRSSLEAQRDPRTVERLAREKLGYAKPGETGVRFYQTSTNAESR